MPTVLKVFLVLFALLAIERFCHRATEGFTLQKVRSELFFHKEWELPPPSKEEQEALQTMLDQPYFFLGSGGQCYAFSSQDGHYVLKFFKHHRMRPIHFLDTLYLPEKLNRMRNKWIAYRHRRLSTIFGSCKLAFVNLKEETALLYVHLNKSTDLCQKITLVDKLHIAHSVDLDQMEFILQRKAKPFLPALLELKRAKEHAAAKRCLLSLLEFLIQRSQKGIGDRDPAIKKNFGLLGEKVIEIDVGSFVEEESLKKSYSGKKQLLLETVKLRKWIKKKYPELLSYFDETVENFICAS